MTFDPRLTPARDDIAALHLRGEIMAERYVPGTDYQVVESAAPLRQKPRSDSALLTQALFGEVVTVYEESEGWVWGQLNDDGYVGYIPLHTLSPRLSRPTHRVSVLRTYIYPEPDIKSPPLDLLSLNSQLCVVHSIYNFNQLETGGFIYSAHTRRFDDFGADFVAVAETFVGTPYLWGGKTSLGLDCSGLVQLSFSACGKSVRRDTDMMLEQLGAEILITSDLSGLQRGDIIFWQGHIAVLCDHTNIVHSNGHHMATVIEPLKVARNRITALFGEITTIKRLSDY
jgi:Bacterial dipeptidyl-peptidase Sh3 domain/NlpC/P60 family